MTPELKQKLLELATELREESRFHYDAWKRSIDGNASVRTQGRLSYDKYATMEHVAGLMEEVTKKEKELV